MFTLDEFEDLLRARPRARLGMFPTPLHPLCGLKKYMGRSDLYIKRDDLTGLGMGGNKTRNLRYLLGRAQQVGAEVVLTSGGPQSNLCRLAAAACARLDMQCVVVHNSSPPAGWAGNQLLSRLAGARLRFIGPVTEEEREEAVAGLAREYRQNGRKTFAVTNGGSTPLGALGYVRAAGEIYRQVRHRNLDIAHIVLPGAMGGTAAGFIAGNFLLGSPFSVHVISVEYPREQLGDILEGLIEGIFALLQVSSRPSEALAGVWLWEDYLGEGYAVASEETLRAVENAARCEGLFMETVYVGKAFAGFSDLCKRRIIPYGSGACFWHTGGTPAVFIQSEMHKLLEEKE